MRSLVLALMAALVLSGCAESPENPDDAGQTGDGGNDGGAGDGGADGVNGRDVANTAPVAELAADVLNGSAPVIVNFTLQGSDSDGDNLTWTLAVNDTQVANGTTLPASVSHNFTEPGNFTVRLEVSDGANTTVSELAIEVAEAAVEAAGPVPEPVVITGTALVPNPVLGSTLLCFRDGIDGDIHDIAPAEPGWDYVLDDGGLWAIYWWGGGSYLGTGADAGTVPSGADQAEICSDTAAAGLDDYVLTLTHPDWEG